MTAVNEFSDFFFWIVFAFSLTQMIEITLDMWTHLERWRIEGAQLFFVCFIFRFFMSYQFCFSKKTKKKKNAVIQCFCQAMPVIQLRWLPKRWLFSRTCRERATRTRPVACLNQFRPRAAATNNKEEERAHVILRKYLLCCTLEMGFGALELADKRIELRQRQLHRHTSHSAAAVVES